MRVGIVGLGLIGGSLALDLLDRGREVVGHDRAADHAAGAAAAGVRMVGSIAEVAAASDLAVVAVPPAHVAATVGELLDASSDVVVTDVASVKAPAALRLSGPLSPRYVGSHPMAGTERSGWAAARRGLLAGAAWLLTPHDDVDPSAFADVATLALDLHARPVVVDMDTHDLLVAAVSHVPHLLAFGLHAAASATAGAAVDLVAGPSFRDATRVAASDPDFWAEVVDRNRTAIRDVVGRIRSWLDDVEAADGADLTAMLAGARREVQVPTASEQVVTLGAGTSVAPAYAQLRALGADGHVVTGVRRDGATVLVTVARG